MSRRAAQRFECEWNDTYQPGKYSQATIDATEAAGGSLEGACNDPTWFAAALAAGYHDAPVTCVDWCDAAAYCAWAGKHLCARLGGGTLDVSDPEGGLYATANESAWYHACSNAGAQPFSYGAEYDATKCNDDESRPKDVGSYDQCVGGFPGIHDMSGNVGEWEDACTDFDSPPVADNCLVRGGTWYNTTATDWSAPRSDRSCAAAPAMASASDAAAELRGVRAPIACWCWPRSRPIPDRQRYWPSHARQPLRAFSCCAVGRVCFVSSSPRPTASTKSRFSALFSHLNGQSHFASNRRRRPNSGAGTRW